MLRAITVALFMVLHFHGNASAWYVSIDAEPVDDRRNGGVIFPITNNTTRDIEFVFGTVYSYKEASPADLRLVSNPHTPAVRITPGPHKPGQKALYWFKVPPYLLTAEKYGVVIWDASIRFSSY